MEEGKILSLFDCFWFELDILKKRRHPSDSESNPDHRAHRITISMDEEVSSSGGFVRRKKKGGGEYGFMEGYGDYGSGKWEIREMNQLMRRLEEVSAGKSEMDMKDFLKCWARTVASSVR